MKRLFFAIPLPDKYREELIHSLPQKIYPGIRWVKQENLHITLHFLGVVEAERTSALIQQATIICESFHPFHLQFNTLKIIFHNRKPTMIWAQFEESKRYESLSYKLRDIFPTGENRKPMPHATLARIKQLRSLPFELPAAKPFSFLVDEIQLWESHLRASGSEYNYVRSFQMAEKHSA